MAAGADRVPAEQRLYARWLAAGVGIGFAALLASFVVYLTGLLPPSIEPSRLPEYWGLPVAEYVAKTGAPTGWSWLWRLGQGDLLNFAGVALLGMTTVACYLRVLPHFARTGQRAYVAICIAQIVVLAAAASGMIFTNH